MSNQSNSVNETQLEIRNIIYELEEKSVNGDYIYRGEPEHYGKISSNLYRQYAEIRVDGFDIEIVQDEMLTEAEAYSHETDDPLDILTQIQHYGGKTNLIDFTTDYLVALFFACDSSESLKKDGRIILLPKTEKLTNWIEEPRNPRHRVIAQKSVFVQHPKGFFNPKDLIITNIPTHLKLPLLDHLRKYHGLSTNTIYNDLHGFITNQSIHESAYTEFHRGLSYYIKGDEAENQQEKQEAYERAVQYYTKALELKPDLPEGYNNRGNAYREKGEIDKAIQDYNNAIKYEENDAVSYNNRGNAYIDINNIDKAIKDYNKAIELTPNFAKAYYNRGNAYFLKSQLNNAIEDYTMAIKCNSDEADAYNKRGEAWLHLQEWDKAKTDLSIAKHMEIDIIAVFHNTYQGIEDFEQSNNVKVPEDIAEILTLEGQKHKN